MQQRPLPVNLEEAIFRGAMSAAAWPSAAHWIDQRRVRAAIRSLPQPQVNAVMREAQGETIMAKQPNFRMWLVCRIENPIGLPLHRLRGCTLVGGGNAWPVPDRRRGDNDKTLTSVGQR